MVPQVKQLLTIKLNRVKQELSWTNKLHKVLWEQQHRCLHELAMMVQFKWREDQLKNHLLQLESLVKLCLLEVHQGGLVKRNP